MNSRPVLGLTMGDPAGIGPELCLRALSHPEVLRQCIPVLFGNAGVLQRLTTAGLPQLTCRTVSLADWETTGAVTEPLLVDCTALDATTIEPGTVSAPCGRAAFHFIERAIQAAMQRKIDGVVTAPVHKEALRLAGVTHPGHTEIFTALTGAKRSCMMLYSDVLTVSMVTTHIGYAEVPGKIAAARVLDVIELTAEALRWMRGQKPRLAVCGLNPHAGEHGLFGKREEERCIQPAISQAIEEGISVAGPLPPDAAFTPAMRKKFDAVVTMYHDQGHIPFKMLAFDTGVNITLGLPIIRTSVDHGTAFDIAWQGKADPQSLLAAIRVAAGLAAGRNQ